MQEGLYFLHQLGRSEEMRSAMPQSFLLQHAAGEVHLQIGNGGREGSLRNLREECFRVQRNHELLRLLDRVHEAGCQLRAML